MDAVRLRAAVGVVVACVASGCSALHRQAQTPTAWTQPGGETDIVVTHGKDRPFVDGVGWVLGIPGKLIFWDSRFLDHDVSPETEDRIVEYLAARDVDGVAVRINEYAPIDEWKRLRANHSVSAGWRYSFGLLDWAGYTLFPGRVFGGDRYNPYTNSLYVYSDIAPLGIHGGAYARDVQSREYPGTYATVNGFSVVSLWHDTIAVDETLDYLEQRGNTEQLEEGLVFLHPYYGSQLGGAADSLIGIGPLLSIGGAVAGHVTGRNEVRKLHASDVEVAAFEAPAAASPSTPPSPVPAPQAEIQQAQFVQP